MGYSIGDVVTFERNNTQRFGRVKGFKLPQKTAWQGPTGLLHGKVSSIIVNMWSQEPFYSCDVATETIDVSPTDLRRSNENAYMRSKLPKMERIKSPADLNSEVDSYMTLSYPIKQPYSNLKTNGLYVFGVEIRAYALEATAHYQLQQHLKRYGLKELTNGNFYLELPEAFQGKFLLRQDNRKGFEELFTEATGIEWDALLYITFIPWGKEA
ncbi:MAG: hypothetical protein CL760_05565 [Chloroflexi bacterium]|nr:hypothetical protein [Chloroflexota bacterium]|tara:strand:- start:18193 stop:18828 length:636 start_codon:yes stop_codon:yes gene_type:complete